MINRLEKLQEMLAARAQDPFVKYALAMEFQRLNRGAECMEMFERVLAEHPEYLPAYLMAGNACAKLGQPERVLQILETGIELASKQGDGKTRGELEDAKAELL